jgi:hypothetical protein
MIAKNVEFAEKMKQMFMSSALVTQSWFLNSKQKHARILTQYTHFCICAFNITKVCYCL